MHKKLLIGLLAGATVLSAVIGLTACKEDYDGTKGLEYSLGDDGTYSVTGIGTCTAANIEIGSTYKNLPVTSIGKDALRSCTALARIQFEGTKAEWKAIEKEDLGTMIYCVVQCTDGKFDGDGKEIE